MLDLYQFMVIILKIQQKCNQPFTIKCNWCMRRHDRIGNDFATFATSKGVDEIFWKGKVGWFMDNKTTIYWKKRV